MSEKNIPNEEKREPYVAIIRRKDSEFVIFANKVEGNPKTDKMITVYTTTKEGKKRCFDLASDIIAEYEHTDA